MSFQVWYNFLDKLDAMTWPGNLLSIVSLLGICMICYFLGYQRNNISQDLLYEDWCKKYDTLTVIGRIMHNDTYSTHDKLYRISQVLENKENIDEYTN